jgi:hypothetical protein
VGSIRSKSISSDETVDVGSLPHPAVEAPALG